MTRRRPRIHVRVKNRTVTACLDALSVPEARAVTSKAQARAVKMLSELAARWRCRPPYSLRALDELGFVTVESRSEIAFDAAAFVRFRNGLSLMVRDGKGNTATVTLERRDASVTRGRVPAS